jgi:hypothetical protein
VTVDGKLADLAEMLEERWQRRVLVPKELRGRSIRKRTLKGTPEQIAAALGLELGPKIRKGRTRALTANTVQIGG